MAPIFNDPDLETKEQTVVPGFQTRADLATAGKVPNRRTLRSFFFNVEPDDSGCWLWQGALNTSGYGVFRGVPAHRWSYGWFVEAFPRDLQCDHLCRVRRCVNPAHIEIVTRSENLRRAADARPTCKRGHIWAPENIVRWTLASGRVVRTCRHCKDHSNAQSMARKKAAS